VPQVPSFQPHGHKPRVGPIQLPAKGYEGEIPPWPLPGRISAAEREGWAQLWRTPQAFAWVQLGWTRTVARYCRIMVRAEKPGSTAAIQAQASKLETELGLTPKAMRLLLWMINQDQPSGQSGGSTPADELEEARRRLRPTASE
jgi:hypothetical protein